MFFCLCRSELNAQTYTIIFKTHQDVGKTVHVKKTQTETIHSLTVESNGRQIRDDKTITSDIAYSVTLISNSKKDQSPKKYKHVYEKATETTFGKTNRLSYHGRELVFEKQNGEFRIGTVGQPGLDIKDLTYLILKAGSVTGLDTYIDKAIVPKKPVTTGETWPIESKAVMSFLHNNDPKTKLVRSEGKLLKVYTQGKVLFGTLEVIFEIEAKSPNSSGKSEGNMSGTFQWVIDTAIDGSSMARKEVGTCQLQEKSTTKLTDKTVSFESLYKIADRYERSAESEDPIGRIVPSVKLVGLNDWIEYTSKEDRFSASFPDKPTTKAKTIDGGDVTKNYVTRSKDNNICYAIVVDSYSSINPIKVKPFTAVNNVADSLSEGTKQKKEIEKDGYYGLELTGEWDDGGSTVPVTRQIFFVNGKLYQVMVIYRPEVKDRVQFRKFLDSFHFQVENEGKHDGTKG
jgi:hypothetical protein